MLANLHRALWPPPHHHGHIPKPWSSRHHALLVQLAGWSHPFLRQTHSAPGALASKRPIAAGPWPLFSTISMPSHGARRSRLGCKHVLPRGRQHRARHGRKRPRCHPALDHSLLHRVLDEPLASAKTIDMWLNLTRLQRKEWPIRRHHARHHAALSKLNRVQHGKCIGVIRQTRRVARVARRRYPSESKNTHRRSWKNPPSLLAKVAHDFEVPRTGRM